MRISGIWRLWESMLVIMIRARRVIILIRIVLRRVRLGFWLMLFWLVILSRGGERRRFWRSWGRLTRFIKIRIFWRMFILRIFLSRLMRMFLSVWRGFRRRLSFLGRLGSIIVSIIILGSLNVRVMRMAIWGNLWRVRFIWFWETRIIIWFVRMRILRFFSILGLTWC